MIKKLFKSILFKVMIVAIIFLSLYRFYIYHMANLHTNEIWFMSNENKITLVLKTFLQEDFQIKYMQILLSRELNNAMVGQLYPISEFTKESSQEIILTRDETMVIVPYVSLAEFLQVNPDCCSIKVVKDRSSCTDNPDPYTSLRGVYSCVMIKYKIRYRDLDGNIKLRVSHHYSAAMVNNQGSIVLWEPYDEVDIG